MSAFEIVAHCGATIEAPENSIPAIEKAIVPGADAVELDVRLTTDGVPVNYHFVYLDGSTSLRSPIFRSIERNAYPITRLFDYTT